jgi:hypothetical protein
MRGILAAAIPCVLVLACGPHRTSVGATGPRREIAVVKVLEATGARLASVDGASVSSPAEIQLTPGDHALGVRYAGKGEDAGAPAELAFHAEAGHLYELSAASPDVAGGEWTPVLVDDSTQAQIYPKK